MHYLKDLDVADKRVLIRADLNVPIGADGKISDPNRIRQFLPTLQFIVENKGKPIVMSHLGDANGKRDSAWSLKSVALSLAELSNLKVNLAPDCIGPEVESMANSLNSGEVLLLENLRFHPGEKNNDPEFSAQLARLGEVYVNDAFGTAHRKHSSLIGVAELFKAKAAGLLMQKELDYYERALVRPKEPLCVVLGGSKVSTKLNALNNIANKADKLIIGGAMANTFLAAQGFQMGRSLVEQDLLGTVVEFLARLARRERKVYLPVDFMVGPSPTARGLARAVPAQELPADTMALDIGPATSILFKEALHTAETIVWNGPMGAFENEDFSKGTTDMIEHIASAHGLSIAAGGDTDAAIHKMELGHKFDFISTGGGAFLSLLEGKTLPAVAALE